VAYDGSGYPGGGRGIPSGFKRGPMEPLKHPPPAKRPPKPPLKKPPAPAPGKPKKPPPPRPLFPKQPDQGKPEKPKFPPLPKQPKPIPFGRPRPAEGVPLPKKGNPALNPFQWRRWSPFNPVDIALDWLLPSQINRNFRITDPAFTGNVNCSSVGPPYIIAPRFGTRRNAACGTDCLLINLSCLSSQTSWTPGTGMGRDALNRPLNIVQMEEAREISPGQYRCHVLAVWCAPTVPASSPQYNPTFNPGQPIFAPTLPPDPFAKNPPGMHQPAPVPVPFNQLPYFPDPDPAILPGGTGQMDRLDEFIWWSPTPGVSLPVPAPIGPGPSPSPNPTPFPRPPSPTPYPNPSPVTGQPPPPPPAYAVPAPASGWRVERDGRVRKDRPTKQQHNRTRPRPREKERKMRWGKVAGMLWQAVGHATEAMDMLDVMYKAIPCQLKLEAGLMGRNINAFDKAAFVAAHLDDMDANEFGRGLLKNQFEDFLYGMQGSQDKRMYQMMYNAGINNPGGKPLSKEASRYNDTAWAFWKEKKKRHKAGLGPDPGPPPTNPIIDQFNGYVDDLFGDVPRGIACCAGKSVSCGKRMKRG